MFEIKNLTFSYPGKRKVLSDLSIKAESGEILGVLGMNGAGKTTLFKTVYQSLIPENGTITLNGQKMEQNNISFLETENFFYTYMRGREYLELISDKNYNQNLNKIFDLPLEALVDDYSTGMKKRLAFWGILEQKKDFIILDEPFNGVDIESVECFYSLIEKLRSEGKTILISSHIIESLLRICDKIAYLKDGTIKKIYYKEQFHTLQEDIQDLIRQKVEKAFSN